MPATVAWSCTEPAGAVPPGSVGAAVSGGSPITVSCGAGGTLEPGIRAPGASTLPGAVPAGGAQACAPGASPALLSRGAAPGAGDPAESGGAHGSGAAASSGVCDARASSDMLGPLC